MWNKLTKNYNFIACLKIIQSPNNWFAQDQLLNSYLYSIP